MTKILTNNIGFIKIHRKILEWEWYDDHNTFRLFFHILLRANFEDKKWRGIDIKRGQFLTSLSKLAESSGLSIKTVRTSLTKLKSTNELTIKGAKQYSLITLTNYCLYQDNDKKEGTEMGIEKDKEGAKEGQRKGKGRAITKESKESKEVKKEYIILADGLIFVLEAKMNKKLPASSQRSYAEEIRKLIEIDLKVRAEAKDDVKRAIQAIGNNYGKDYFPVIQSGGSFREKFVKIEDYLKRTQNNKKTELADTYNNLMQKFKNEENDNNSMLD